MFQSYPSSTTDEGFLSYLWSTYGVFTPYLLLRIKTRGL